MCCVSGKEYPLPTIFKVPAFASNNFRLPSPARPEASSPPMRIMYSSYLLLSSMTVIICPPPVAPLLGKRACLSIPISQDARELFASPGRTGVAPCPTVSPGDEEDEENKKEEQMGEMARRAFPCPYGKAGLCCIAP